MVFAAEEAKAREIDLALSLKQHRSAEVLLKLGTAIITGHTGTNVLDLRVILIR